MDEATKKEITGRRNLVDRLEALAACAANLQEGLSQMNGLATRAQKISIMHIRTMAVAGDSPLSEAEKGIILKPEKTLDILEPTVKLMKKRMEELADEIKAAGWIEQLEKLLESMIEAARQDAS